MHHPPPPPISPQMFNRRHLHPHFQRNHNFEPRGGGGLVGPRPWYPRRQLHGASRMEMYCDEHWCETCDRSFRTVALLEQHEQQHEKCNIDGCKFTAHPKVITKHIQMQHSTGLFQKIANLKNPEDIHKWREERKKKYPTKENVAKKAAEMKEKIERGEKMGLRKDKNKHSRNHSPGEAQKRKFSQINENVINKINITFNKTEPNNKIIKRKKKERAIPAAKEKQNLKPFGGIQGLFIENDTENVDEPEHNGFLIEDDDLEDTVSEKQFTSTTEKPTVCTALSSLMCEYGSTDDETEVEPKIQQVPIIVEINTNQIISRASLVNMQAKKSEEDIKPEAKGSDEDDSCGPEEVKVEKFVEDSTNLNNKEKTKPVLVSSQKSKTNVQAKKCVNKKTKPKVPSTLIYKLLHKEIQQERNIVLQCIRHIVKNNYFD